MSEQNINEEEFKNKIKNLRKSYSELGDREAKVSGNLSSILKRIREKASLKNSIEEELSTLRKCYEQMKTNELQSIHAHKKEVVHHINGDHTCNILDNIEVMNHSDHSKMHIL